MSRSHQQFTVRTFMEYMEQVAAQHTSIGHTDAQPHFTRFNALMALEDQFTKLQSPALMCEHFEAEGVDAKSDNLMVRRYVAYTVAVKVPGGLRSTGHDGVLQLEEQAETIALQVLGRMRNDRIHRGGTIFGEVDMDNWQGQVATPLFNGSWAAYRITIPVSMVDRRLSYDSQVWDGDVSSPIYEDLTGLSCANLNHPTYGLTITQRLSCILPQYDFSTVAVQEALSEAQVADLEEWLGVGGGDPVSIFLSNGTTLVQSVAAGGSFSIPRHLVRYEEYDESGFVTLADAEHNVDTDIGRIAVTAGGTLLFWTDVNADREATSGGVYLGKRALIMPQVRIEFERAGDAATMTYADVPIDSYLSGPDVLHLGAGSVIPRITLYESDGTTVFAYVAVDSPTYTIPAVTILDQDSNPVASVEAGEDYNVLVFSGINDTGPSYSNSIVDNG